MSELSMKDLINRVLSESNKPLSPNEIWNYTIKKGYDKQSNLKGKTPAQTISSWLYRCLQNNNEPEYQVVGSRPKRYALKSFTVSTEFDEENFEEVKPKKHRTSFREIDLHSFLSYYAFSTLKVYTKTIKHQTTSKRGAKSSQWLHPDIVGAFYSFEQWSGEVASLSQELGIPLARLYSFELKKELNFGNLRESFFQAVSNSSWANEGYLVAASIPTDDEFLMELKRLSSAFRIGIIHLDVEDPDASSIILPASTKTEIDWDTVSELSKNKDFRTFINRVKIDTSSKEIRKEQYDKVLEPEMLKEILFA